MTPQEILVATLAIYICYTLAPDKNENLLSNSSPFQLMQHQRNVGLLSNTYVLQSIIGH